MTVDECVADSDTASEIASVDGQNKDRFVVHHKYKRFVELVQTDTLKHNRHIDII